jgi:hypothetical protein
VRCGLPPEEVLFFLSVVAVKCLVKKVQELTGNFLWLNRKLQQSGLIA